MESTLHESHQEDQEHPGMPATYCNIWIAMVLSSICVPRYPWASQRFLGFPQKLCLAVIGNTLYLGSPCTFAFAIHVRYWNRDIGKAKDPSAPLIFKTTVSLFGFLDQKDRLEFLILNLADAFRTIPALPAAPLAEPLLKHLQASASVALLQLSGTVLADPRLKE